MNYFPVINSTLSAKAIAVFLQKKYLLSRNTHCRLIKAGINDSYLVEDGTDKYVFRVYSLLWRTEKEIAEEIRLLNLLKSHSLPVSYPQADAEHRFIQILNAPEGERFAVLFSFAPGDKKANLSGEQHFLVGQLMAKLHQVTFNQIAERVTYTPEVLLVDSLNKLSSFLKDDTEEMNFMKSTQVRLLKELKLADLSNIRHGIVHLDIWFDNTSIAIDNQITIFDFDFCGNGWLCMDLAYYILQLHNVEKYEPGNYQPKLDRFLNGYESISPISDEEKRLIPMLGVSLYYFYLGVQCQRYDNWSNSFLNENYLKRFINGLVRRYYDIYKTVGGNSF